MPEFRITQKNGRVHMVYVDDEDSHLFAEHKWGVRKGGNTFYVDRTMFIDGKETSEQLHRRIMGLQPGNRMKVDHRNGNGCDNRRSNLRVCTQQQNTFNTAISSNNTSGFKGVSWNEEMQKWRAKIGHNGRQIHIGYYDDPEVANAARVAKAEELFGEFNRPV